MRKTTLFLFAVTIVLGGCYDQEFAELQEGQRELRTKLAALEQKLDALGARPQPPSAAPPSADPNVPVDIPVGESAVRGPADAAVTVVEFADYQCPFCARNVPLVKQILEAYPEQVKFVFKEFPLTSIHRNALPAAKAAIAAQNQGKYWEMHDILFDNFQSLDSDSIARFAQEIGLDVAKWQADMDSEEVDKRVQEDLRLGRSIGVRGTPTMFINGLRVMDRSFEAIKDTIDRNLAKKD